MTRAVFSAGLLIDGTGQAPRQDPYLLVEDGRIREIGTGPAPEAWLQGGPAGTQVEQVAMSGATIIPGMIDAHLHLALALSRPDWPQIDAEPGRMALLAAQGAQETLRAGVTTIAVRKGMNNGQAVMEADGDLIRREGAPFDPEGTIGAKVAQLTCYLP